jgi:hypothetical protein
MTTIFFWIGVGTAALAVSYIIICLAVGAKRYMDRCRRDRTRAEKNRREMRRKLFREG